MSIVIVHAEQYDHGKLIHWFVFPPIVAKWAQPNNKNISIIIFLISPDSGISPGRGSINGPSVMVNLSNF